MLPKLQPSPEDAPGAPSQERGATSPCCPWVSPEPPSCPAHLLRGLLGVYLSPRPHSRGCRRAQQGAPAGCGRRMLLALSEAPFWSQRWEQCPAHVSHPELGDLGTPPRAAPIPRGWGCVQPPRRVQRGSLAQCRCHRKMSPKQPPPAAPPREALPDSQRIPTARSACHIPCATIPHHDPTARSWHHIPCATTPQQAPSPCSRTFPVPRSCAMIPHHALAPHSDHVPTPHSHAVLLHSIPTPLL